MEQVSIVSFSSPFTFDWTIPNISKLKTMFSPEFVIEGIPWKIGIINILSSSKQCVRAFLLCTKTNIPSNWLQAVSAVIELLAVDGKTNESSRIVFEPFVVDTSMLRYSSHRIFEIENKYVHNDTIKFNIKIAVDSYDATNKSVLKSESLGSFCKCGSTAKFRVTVTNVKHLMAVRSPDFELNGVTSHVIVRKVYSSRLGIRLNSTRPCMAKLTTTLISSKKTVKPIVQSVSTEKAKKTIQRTMSIQWLDLLKPANGFARNGSITLEVEVVMENPTTEKRRNEHKRQAHQAPTGAKAPKFECAICKKSILGQDMSSTPCGHLFCTTCITNAIKDRKICPSCNGRVPWNGLRRMHWPIAE